MKTALILLVALVAVSQVSAIETVKALDVNKYTGLWYQTFASPLVVNTFERNGVCITAEYGLAMDGSITVLNRQRQKTPTGEEKTITGFAKLDNPAEPGKLSVTLFGGAAGAPYWVVALGPDTFDGKYQWAIVTDPFKISLFVLARDPQVFAKLYEAEVLKTLDTLGFNHFWNKPIKTLQTPECLYPTPAI
eukprot:Colp12_sorted_trinity150504_noHs@4832